MSSLHVEQKIKNLLRLGAQQNASDLHFAVGRHPTFRIDGKLIPLEQEAVLTPDDTKQYAEYLMTSNTKEQFVKDGEVDFAYSLEDKVRFRTNVFYQRGYVGVVMRVISSEIHPLEELGVPQLVYEFANFSQGLFLVTGPMGHGKSTTLAALIDYINHNKKHHIVTIEDPIEYMYEQDRCIINQRELGQDTQSFSGALRAALREDANVILLGELRDVETISTAITAAETGHLIFATLHTNDASQTVDRIIDSFASHQQNQVRSQLANVLLGVMSQRLIPHTNGGRIPAVEIMIKNNAVENLIREDKTYQIDTVIETSQKEGMISLDKSLAELLQAGDITLDHAMTYAKNRDYVRMLVGRGEQIHIEE
ncbi:MAG: type IV pilus twitching motility protein PilT [Candidatus Moraniibacteriota bacterium]|jgi:twitching motility protein PilT